MEEITEEQVTSIFGLDLNDPETRVMWDDTGLIIEAMKIKRQEIIAAWKRLEPAFKAAYDFAQATYRLQHQAGMSEAELARISHDILRLAQISPKPKQRSSRRLAVQAKRKRLGLPVDGKIAPFPYDGGMSFADMLNPHFKPTIKTCKPTKRESLEAALQADRIFRHHPEWVEENAEAHRQRVIRNWLRWQTKAGYR